MAKINILHWHLVDETSFPMDVPSRPLLSSKGAYNSIERYTPQDLTDIVEYARKRGVRVMPEIDVPGHAASWCKGYPEVCPDPKCLEPLDVSNNATFDLVEDIFKFITGGKKGAGVFPDNMFHLGGDEVSTGCWQITPHVKEWLDGRGLDMDGGYEYFVKRAQGLAKGMGRDLVGWNEIWDHFGTELDPTTIIHFWIGSPSLVQNVTSHGYRVLFSNSDWYLDHLAVPWTHVYDTSPCVGLEAQPDVCSKLVLGGEGCMWGETVDSSDIMATVWPKLAAVGERLWSPDGTKSSDAGVFERYQHLRCMLDQRGFQAAPSNNSAARSAPPGPGSCYQRR